MSVRYPSLALCLTTLTLLASCGSSGDGSSQNNPENNVGDPDVSDGSTVSGSDSSASNTDQTTITDSTGSAIGDDGTTDVSNEGAIGTGVSDSDPSVSNADQTTITDSSGSAIGDVGTTDVSNEGVIGTGVTNNDAALNSVCGSVDNSFSYAFRGAPFPLRGYLIEAPVAGFGWNGSDFCDMDNSVGVDSLAVLIPQLDTTPIIDGDFNDDIWARSAQTGFIDGPADTNITNNLLENSVPGYQDGARSGDWWALHDNEYLYITYFARNETSSTGNNQVFRDSIDPRNDDSIDIYIDGDNSKGQSYDGVDDFHITIAYLDDRNQFHYGANSSDGLQLELATDVPEFGSSYVYEVKIDLASAGITVGKPFGLDIQLNEDDNGGVADARFGWAEPSGSAVADTNPSVFGTVLLTGCAEGNSCGTEQLLNPAL